jgi:adenylate kinase family enzyme
MAELLMLVGPPGGGKSTWAKQHIQNSKYVYINQDVLGKGHLEVFTKAVEDHQNIIVDRMNFNKSQRNRYLELVNKANYKTSIMIFHLPYDECLTRCKTRKQHPTITTDEEADKAVCSFFRNYERVSDDEADSVIRMGWVGNSTEDVIIADLDGTLANVEHRRHLVQKYNTNTNSSNQDMIDGSNFKPNWKKFFENMVHDPVNAWCKDILYHMSESKRIVYVTGRPADYRDQTETWLSYNGCYFPGSQLFMRLSGDSRKDEIVKEIILDFEIKTRYGVYFVIDDRTQVVNMWRKHGYVALQCDRGDF